MSPFIHSDVVSFICFFGETLNYKFWGYKSKTKTKQKSNAKQNRKAKPNKKVKQSKTKQKAMQNKKQINIKHHHQKKKKKTQTKQNIKTPKKTNVLPLYGEARMCCLFIYFCIRKNKMGLER